MHSIIGRALPDGFHLSNLSSAPGVVARHHDTKVRMYILRGGGGGGIGMLIRNGGMECIKESGGRSWLFLRIPSTPGVGGKGWVGG